MLDHIHQAADYIKTKSAESFEIAMILGTGLGSLAKDIDVIQEIQYEEIPYFPVSTVEGHSGKLILGQMSGVAIIVLQGRFHYYEGYTLQETTFPIRVLKAIGVKTLLLSNASGGLNPLHKIGDIMLIDDHIHLFPDNPLRGKNITELGSRFPDMSEPYCFDLLQLAENLCLKHNIQVHRGVYLGTQGPNYETKAEYKFFRRIGADAVGMSTTSETIVAVHSGMKVFAVSVIADLGVEGQIVEISHEEVQAVAAIVEPKLSLLFKEMITKYISKSSMVNADN